MPDGPTYEDYGLVDPYMARDVIRAKDAEIERLRAENAELLEALKATDHYLFQFTPLPLREQIRTIIAKMEGR